jgi:amidohydrolase
LLIRHNLILACVLCLVPSALIAQDRDPTLQKPNAPLVSIYKDLHTHPELSHHEERTSAILAQNLRDAGYTVTDHVGLYPDGSHAFGVVAILKNGPGPTLLIRADMDALPIVEETGLPYASHVTVTNAAGQKVGVMHACGHDIHTTVLIGTARAMAANKSQWHGTLMLIGQPSEESIDGAKALLADHLYERFGRPDKIIGLHDINTLAAGQVGILAGPAMASSTSIDVVIHGMGGHGAAPQLGRDPITLAALFITQIQTIVSREEDPQDPSVVTVGDIHGGTRRNIIPDSVKLELTTRAFTPHARQVIITGLQQMAAGITTSAGLPADKAATVTVLEDESAPVTVLEDESAPVQVNDPALTANVQATLIKTLGAANVRPVEKIMASEDVGVLSLNQQIPLVYFRLGAMDPAKLAAAEAQGKTLPGLHTSRFEPLPEPTIATGVKTMSAVATSLLQ